MYKQHVRRTLVFGILGLIIAVAVAITSNKIYESRLELLVGDQATTARQQVQKYDQDVQQILDQGNPRSADTERQIISGYTVFYEAFLNVADRYNRRDLIEDWLSYYAMYDIEAPRTNSQQTSSGLVAIKVRAYEPKFAADLANEIGIVFNEKRKSNAAQAVQNALTYVESQIEAAEKDLHQAKSNVKAYKEQIQMPDFMAGVRNDVTRESGLNQNIQDLQANLSGARAELASARSELARTPKYVRTGSSSVVDPVLQQYDQQLSVLNAQLSQHRSVYTDEAPQVRQVMDSIADLEAKARLLREKQMKTAQTQEAINPVYQTLQQSIAALQGRVDNIASQIAESSSLLAAHKDKSKAYPGYELTLDELQTKVDIFQRRYTTLKAQAEDLRTSRETGAKAAIIQGEALVNNVPVAPNVSKFAFVGLIAGFCLGLIFSFAADSIKMRVQSSSQLSELTGLPVVAALPSGRMASRSIRALSRAGVSPAEAFRFMAFSMVAKAGQSKQSFLFTGINTPAGSYTSAVQFATAVARMGVKTLLVDCDLVRSPITREFEAAGKSGISNVIAEGASALDPSSFVISTEHDNLYLVPAGTENKRFLTDVSASVLQGAVERLQEIGDVVIFAAPPCDVLADASCLAPYADDVCLVVSGRNTSYRSVPVAYELLTKAGAKKVSLVLTDASQEEEPFARRAAYLAKVE